MIPALVLLALSFTNHFPQTRVNAVYAVSPASPLIVYAAENGVLYRSVDGGATFAARSGGAGTTLTVDPENPDIVYDVLGHRRSDDGGATWTPFGAGASGVRMTIDPTNPSTIYLFGACSGSNSPLAGVFVSHDRGAAWQQDTSACTFDVAIDPLPPHGQYRTTSPFGGSAQQPARQIVADSRWPVRYGLPTSPRNLVLFSSDGTTWQPFGPDQIDTPSINALALDGERGHLFAATNDGLFLSSGNIPVWTRLLPGIARGVTVAGDRVYAVMANGLVYAPLATLAPFTPVTPLPLVPAAARGLAADPHARAVYATADVVAADGTPLGSVWRSGDGGATWQPIAPNDPLSRGAIAVDGAGDVYAFDAITAGGEFVADVFHYDAASGTSEHYSTSITLGMQRLLFADPHRRGVLFTIENGLLYRAGDGGHLWRLQSSFNDGTKWIAAKSMTFGRPGTIFVATDAGLYRTVDDGASWSALDSADTSLVEAAPSRPSMLYRIGAAGLSRSDDEGSTWTARTLPASFIVRLRVDPINEDSLWIADDGGQLWHSADGGATWSLAGQLAGPIADVAVDGTFVHAALADGVWDAPIRANRRRPAVCCGRSTP